MDLECGLVTGETVGGITNRPDWGYGVWFNDRPPTGPRDGAFGAMPIPEDHNGGSVTLYFWVAGTNDDVLRVVPTWDAPGTELITTDCEPPLSPTTTPGPPANDPCLGMTIVRAADGREVCLTLPATR